MNQDAHKDAAEALLGLLPKTPPAEVGSVNIQVASVLLQRALVHATLATIPDPASPIEAKSWPTCLCGKFDHPHIWGAGCPDQVGAAIRFDPMPPTTRDDVQGLHGRWEDPHGDWRFCPRCFPVPSDGPGQ